MVWRMALIIGACEFVLMLAAWALRGVFEGVLPVAVALADALLLTAMATPMISRWVIAPFARANKEAMSRMEGLATTDRLTGMANRRAFDKAVEIEHSRHSRSGALMSVLMLDVDFFKNYNDIYGHLSGDECLRMVGMVIMGAVPRQTDLAARYGGEEFVCVLANTGSAEAVAIAERIRFGVEAVAMPNSGSPLGVVTLSAGVATSQCHQAGSALELIGHADGLLYSAKEQGRNAVASGLFVPSQYGLDVGRLAAAGGLARLVWQDDHLCGDDEVDAQHKELFDIANSVLDVILKGGGEEELFDLEKGLMDVISNHFKTEERVLEQAGYAGLAEHKRDHEALMERAKRLEQGFSKGNGAMIGTLFRFLANDVIMGHMLHSDKKWFAFLRDKASGLPMDPADPS